MRYFNYLTKEDRDAIFFKLPEPFDKETPRATLAYALGATLYMPGTRESISKDIISQKNEKPRKISSSVMSLRIKSYCIFAILMLK